MNDRQIRDILVSYLQASDGRLRIYQEKTIGSSVCDVMAVTTILTGYEIKSDVDNLDRLPSQIASYDAFFDKCFIVTGDYHRNRVERAAPSHWGILCMQDSSIDLIREARPNTHVRRRSQLSMLWKLELKNLLVKNSLPLFAQKNKGFISDRIAESVPADVLGPQIAAELMSRDYSTYDAEDPTIQVTGAAFRMREMVDALSEENLADYSLDQWIGLYRRAKEIAETKASLYQAAAVARTPHDITYESIEPTLGAPWISKSIVEDFIFELLELDKCDRRFCKVEYEEVTGSWFVCNKRWLAEGNQNALSRYGLPRYNALNIIDSTLNLREIRLFDGYNRSQFNERDTVAALEKQRLITQRFAEWVWEDQDRIWEIEEAYNQLFSSYERPEYDGSHLAFPELSPEIVLFPHQRDAVQRILSEPNTLLAFDVGAGKTFIMIAAAMKLRDEGASRKNMFVVPNHIVGQWEKAFTDLYPQAKVLAIEPKLFKPEMRQKALRQMRDGDYDGIIIAYSCFEQIPLSDSAVQENMQRELARIQSATAGLTWCWKRRCLDAEMNRIRKLTGDFLKSMSPTFGLGISFDELGVDTLFVDEAHNYKNLPIRTRLKNLRGISTKGSSKCLDMLQKIRCVQANGRGAVLATGTPLCNSISDAYAMQMYLQIRELERAHLDVFDNWVKTFAKPEQLFEIDVNATRYRMVRKFVRFHNLPELSAMFSQFAIFHAVETDGIPEVEDHTDVVIRRYPELAEFMQSLCDRSDEIRTGKINPRFDNMLKVSTDGRKAALDLALVGRFQPRGDCYKVDRCARQVMSLYTSEPGTTQLVFCDYSTPKGDQYNIYEILKERLCALGIPAAEIAFIHSYTTESRKLSLYDRFNRGEVRVLVGSTFKLGIGANVQERLRAIHHLDVPWRPADMVQREGRMIRRGNTCAHVQIYRYIAEGSFDSYSWQILETKQRFISQFLSGSSYERTASDLEDNVLSYAEVKALALYDSRMKLLARKENEAKRLRVLSAQQEESQERQQAELADLRERVLALKARVAATLENANYYAGIDSAQKKHARKLLGDNLSVECADGHASMSHPTMDILGFEVRLTSPDDKGKQYAIISRFGQEYKTLLGPSPSGNVRRIFNVLGKMESIAQSDRGEQEDLEGKITGIVEHIDSSTNPYSKRLTELEAEIQALRGELT